MKKLLLMTLLAGACHVNAQTTYPGGITGCIARWDFANFGNPIASVPDVSGNGHHSSSVSALTTAAGFRNAPNKAMSFNGTSSMATVPYASMLAPSNITMIAMVKNAGFYSGTCQHSQIISKGTLGYTPGNYGLAWGDNVYDNDCYAYNPNNMQLYGFLGTIQPAASGTAGNYVTTNQWYFVAVTYNGNTIKHYQVVMDPNNYIGNITPSYTGTNTTGMGTNTADLAIGSHNSTLYPYWFNGSMEEVALFNRALPDSEIQKVYDYLWGIVKITSVSVNNVCAGQSLTVNYTVNNTSFFQSNNVFTVQLSNASGSFASPVTIGSATATGGGTINCTIPTNTPAGTGYRTRIVASNVPYTTADNGVNITISNIAKPSITSNAPLCVGQTLTLSGNSSVPGAVYHWYGPNGFSSTQQNPTISGISPANAGIYTLYVTANGCTSAIDSHTVAIVSSQTSTVTSYVSPGDTICAGETAGFYALVLNGGSGIQYQWLKFGTPIPGETSSTYITKTLATGDIISCQVTTPGCGSSNTIASNSHTMAILPKGPAEVTITADPGLLLSPWQLVTFTANVVNGGTNPVFQWKRNGMDVAGANSSTWGAYNLIDNDSISVVVTSNYPCAVPATASSQALVVNIKTSVDDLTGTGNKILIHPNPNNGTFSIKGNLHGGKQQYLEITNLLGQSLYTEVLGEGKSVEKEIRVSHLPNGIYILNISGDSHIRFSIQR